MLLNNFTAKQIINTLKNGVIPDADPDLLCTGRDNIVKEIDRCLDAVEAGGGYVKFITGEYGSGKSFMLNKIKKNALKRDFAVCRLQVNSSFNLASFDTLYYNIMHNISIKSSAAGADFETMFGSWIGRMKLSYDKNRVYEEINEVVSSLENFNSSFARAFLTYIKARIAQDSELSNAAASWIKGEKNIPSHLKARFNVKGDIDRLSSMDSFKAFLHLVKLLGYSGMVILVDELELVMNYRSDIRKNCYENLRYLVDNTFGGDFANCMFVLAATDDFFEDSERGIKTYYALYQRLGEHVTGVSDNHDIRQPILHMSKLSHDELLSLTEKVIAIHRTAFSWTPSISPESARNWALVTLSRGKSSSQLVNTREYIKKLVELLDILEQNPGYSFFGSEMKNMSRSASDFYAGVRQ